MKGILHRDSRQFPRAQAAFEKALAINENSMRTLTARAAMWMDIGELAKAKVDLDMAATQGGASLEMIYLSAMLLFQEGKAEEARALLRARAVEIEPVREDVRTKLPKKSLMLGVVAYFEKNYGQAVKHLRSFLEVVPGHRAATRYLAGAYLGLKDYKQVIGLYRPSPSPSPSTALPQDPLALALALLAEAYRASGDYTQTEKHITSASRIGPALASVGMRVAMGRLSDGRTSKAIADLEKLSKRFPVLVEIHAQLARAYVKAGKAVEAVEAQSVADRLVSSLPDNAWVQILAGSIALARGDLVDSRRHFQTANTLARDLLMPRVNLARLDRLDGNPRQAEFGYREVLKDFPGHEISGIELARLYLAGDDVRGAQDTVDTVLIANPENFEAHHLQMKAVFASSPSASDVQSAIEQLLSRFKQEPRAHLMAARTYRVSGELDKAREHFKAASQLLPVASIEVYSIAQQQFAIGDLEAARE